MGGGHFQLKQSERASWRRRLLSWDLRDEKEWGMWIIEEAKSRHRGEMNAWCIPVAERRSGVCGAENSKWIELRAMRWQDSNQANNLQFTRQVGKEGGVPCTLKVSPLQLCGACAIREKAARPWRRTGRWGAGRVVGGRGQTVLVAVYLFPEPPEQITTTWLS